jgi:hypothetical protein
MHVRVAWEIYHHQAKQNPEKASSVAGVKPESMLRPHMYPPSSPSVARPHEMPPTPTGFPNPNALPGRPFDQLTANFLGSPSSHLGELIENLDCSGCSDELFFYYRSFTLRSVWITVWISIQWFVALRAGYADGWTDPRSLEKVR